MKRMKKAQKRMVMLAVGILAAVAIIFSQLFYYQSLEHNKKEVKTEQQQNQTSEDETFFSVPSTNLPSSTQVELHHKSFLLLEIFFEDDEVETDHEPVTLHFSTFLQTLFSAIISPNAP
jgi:hypothetical protein